MTNETQDIAPPLPAEPCPIPLWRLILRAVLVMILAFQLNKGLAYCNVRFGTTAYELDFHDMAQPPTDEALIAWGRRQPEFSGIEVLRRGSETVVRISSPLGSSYSSLPALVSEMTRLGYRGSSKVKATLSPASFLLKTSLWYLLQAAIGLAGIAWARRRGEPIPHCSERHFAQQFWRRWRSRFALSW